MRSAEKADERAPKWGCGVLIRSLAHDYHREPLAETGRPEAPPKGHTFHEDRL